MEIVIYLLGRIFYYLLAALELLMFVRAILSWFPAAPEGRLSDFIFSVTETVVTPMRLLLDRFSWTRRVPVDLSFFGTFLVIILLQSILGAFL